MTSWLSLMDYKLSVWMDKNGSLLLIICLALIFIAFVFCLIYSWLLFCNWPFSLPNSCFISTKSESVLKSSAFWVNGIH